jgi:hypothetical protein
MRELEQDIIQSWSRMSGKQKQRRDQKKAVNGRE